MSGLSDLHQEETIKGGKKHGFEKEIGKNKLVIQQKLQVMKIFLFLYEQKLLPHSTKDLNNCHDLIIKENIHTHDEHLKIKISSRQFPDLRMLSLFIIYLHHLSTLSSLSLSSYLHYLSIPFNKHATVVQVKPIATELPPLR